MAPILPAGHVIPHPGGPARPAQCVIKTQFAMSSQDAALL